MIKRQGPQAARVIARSNASRKQDLAAVLCRVARFMAQGSPSVLCRKSLTRSADPGNHTRTRLAYDDPAASPRVRRGSAGSRCSRRASAIARRTVHDADALYQGCPGGARPRRSVPCRHSCRRRTTRLTALENTFVLAQLLQALVEPRFDHRLGKLEHFGDLGPRQPVAVPQAQHLALLRRQGGDQMRDA